MQAASDIFLGWTEDKIRDASFTFVTSRTDASARLAKSSKATRLRLMRHFAAYTIARTCAVGRSRILAGYMGKSDGLDDALANFAMTYAEQTKRDHARLTAWLAEKYSKTLKT